MITSSAKNIFTRAELLDTKKFPVETDIKKLLVVSDGALGIDSKNRLIAFGETNCRIKAYSNINTTVNGVYWDESDDIYRVDAVDMQVWQSTENYHDYVSVILTSSGVAYSISNKDDYVGRETDDVRYYNYGPMNNPDEDGYNIVKFFEAPKYGRVGMGYITDQDENNAYVWGDNPNGMLSIGDSDGEELPTRVIGFEGKKT